MPPAPRPTPPAKEPALPRRERVALAVGALVLAALAFAQAPGRIVPETKLDVFADPVGFLSRALSAWDPDAGLGRVQNQAIGYLFPMGAFTATGRALGLPVWAVQRLWIAVVLVAGLWGAHRVARALGIATPAGRLVAAWAYALAPATLGLVAFQSAGQLPYALAPWVLVPLLTARDGDDPRRVAARSALWIVAMGGVNGASSLAVLPLPILWLATRRRGTDRRRLSQWWAAGVVAASLWWLVPLLVTVRYGIRFTDYTELAETTTFTQSATEVLRGTGNWLGYLQTPAGPWLPGSWQMATAAVAVVGSVAVAAAGLAGLCRRDLPERTWLVLCVLVGAVAMGIGYAGDGSGWLAAPARLLLDGPFVPFRNVHKVAAVVRLPLALGLGHLVTTVLVGTRDAAPSPSRSAAPPTPEHERPGRPSRLGGPVLARAAAVVAVVAVAAAVVPAADELTAPGDFDDVPAAWDAAAWLDDQPGDGRALLLPGSAFAEYRWGRPLDEPMAVLAERPWAVRDLIPLGGHGSTRLLDGIDRALATDAVPPGFVVTLERMGVSHLLVRNDLDLDRTGGPAPSSVRRLLAGTDGLDLVVSFGRTLAEVPTDGRLDPRPGQAATAEVRELDVYAVADPTPVATAYPAAGALTANGSAEGLLAMPPDLLEGRATFVGEAPPSAATDLVAVAIDSARRRDVRFGRVRNGSSWTLADDEPSPLTGEEPVDRWQDEEPPAQTMRAADGGTVVRDGADPDPTRRPENHPAAALDGDPTTTWAVPLRSEARWMEVDLEEPAALGTLTIATTPGTGVRPARLRLTTDDDTRDVAVPDDGVVEVAMGDDLVSSLRVEITHTRGDGGSGVIGIAELSSPGLTGVGPLVVPDPGAPPAVVVLSRDRADRFDGARRDEDGVLDRRFGWVGGEATLRGTATAAPEADITFEEPVPAPPSGDGQAGLDASASSTFRDERILGPASAIDGDPATAWVSGTEDPAPRLRVRWADPVAIDGIRLDLLRWGVDPDHQVVVHVGGSSYPVDLDAAGRATFAATVATELEVELRDPPGVVDLAPAGVVELEVPALVGRGTSPIDPTVTMPEACGDGPPVTIDGRAVPTRVQATVGDLVSGAAVPWEACEPVPLAAGDHRMVAAKDELVVSTAVVEPVAGIPPVGPGRTSTVRRWDREDRSVEVGAGDAAVLATTENANDGWQATLDGDVLDPVTVDGWRQGWVVPGGEGGTVALTYLPGRAQRIGLLVGAVALALLIAAAVVAPRRTRTWQPPTAGTAPRWLGVASAVIAGVALGGWAVLVVVPAVALARRRPGLLGPTAAASLGLAGLVALTGESGTPGTGTFSAPAQLLAAIAVVLVAVALGRPAEEAADPGVGPNPETGPSLR